MHLKGFAIADPEHHDFIDQQGRLSAVRSAQAFIFRGTLWCVWACLWSFSPFFASPPPPRIHSHVEQLTRYEKPSILQTFIVQPRVLLLEGRWDTWVVLDIRHVWSIKGFFFPTMWIPCLSLCEGRTLFYLNNLVHSWFSSHWCK